MTETIGPSIIDAHIHTWQWKDGRNIWIREKIGALHRDFSLTDFKDQNTGLNLQGVYLVQAAAEKNETFELLSRYADDPLVKGVVGWADLAADDIEHEVQRLLEHPKFSGIRAHPPHQFDANWLTSKPALRGMNVLTAKNVPIDFLVNTTQLQTFRNVFDEVPDVCAVLNHGGRPFVMTGDTTEWARDMGMLAQETNCYCKLSGLAERAGVEWNKETLKPWIGILIDAFGPERLIFASNWPIMTLMATPKIWVDTLVEIFDDFGLPHTSREQILNSTARDVYERRSTL